MPERIGPDVTDGMRRGIGVAVRMAVEARDTLMRLHAPPVLRHVELLLWKRSDQQAKSLKLFWIENLFEQPLEVVERDELSCRDVSQIRTRHKKYCRRKFWNEVIGKIEIEIEPREITPSLLGRLVDQ